MLLRFRFSPLLSDSLLSMCFPFHITQLMGSQLPRFFEENFFHCSMTRLQSMTSLFFLSRRKCFFFPSKMSLRRSNFLLKHRIQLTRQISQHRLDVVYNHVSLLSLLVLEMMRVITTLTSASLEWR